MIIVEIKNCNNIDTGSISLKKNKLNIKYGINGTGKSTIAKAIKYGIESPDKLKELTPFKVKSAKSEIKSEAIIPEDIRSVSIFNEEYLNQFVYKEDELISNSFQIFIQTPSYLETEKKIEIQLEIIKKVFLNNSDLDKIILDFENLSKSFKTTKDGLSDASAISKGLKNGNKIENIPDGLEDYKPFIQNKEKCVSWLEWQIKGNDFSHEHDSCPYCVSPTDESKKVKIKSISENYDKNVIKNFIEIIRVLEDLGDYFSTVSKHKLKEITKKTDGLLLEEKTYLVTIKGQIDSFLQRLKSLKDVSFHNLKDEKIKEKIESLKIKIDESFDKLKSDKTEKIVEEFNQSLNTTLEQITGLQKNIGKQKTEIRKSIEKNQEHINQFLIKAGYKYEVLITNEDYKLRLKHIESDEKISRGNQYLSFGEKNAFALVLFMYETLSKKPDLIVLDDPISSFDKNKKYAIMDMLFREDNSFKGKTVLMLTHDIEPIIDSVKVLHKKFGNLTNACFISTTNNKVNELEITKGDLMSFSQICNQIIASGSINEIIKIIYLRRYYESIDDRGNEYEVLSNLLHKRTKDEAIDQRKEKTDDEYQKLSEEDFNNGIDGIKTKIENFDYDSLLNNFRNNEQITKIYKQTDDSFAKLILFRIIIDGLEKNKKPDDVFMKFINEVYHIENELLFQLNPNKYNIAPQFIIEKCDNFIKEYSNE